jgi:hypothetical protein
MATPTMNRQLIIIIILSIGVISHTTNNTHELTETIQLDNTLPTKHNRISRTPILDTTNLTAWWKLDEGTGTIVNDSSDNSYNGTIDGAEWTDEYQGFGLDFSTDFVNITDNDDFSFTDGDDTAFSITGWVNIESFATRNAILTKWNDVGDNREWRVSVETDGKIKVLMYNFDSNVNRIGRKTDDDIVAGNWYFVTITYNGSEVETGINIYLNSTLASGYTTDNAGNYLGMSNTNSHVFIGARTGITDFLSGIVDDIRIYDKELNQTEINELYNYTITNIQEVRTNRNNRYSLVANTQGNLNESMSFTLIVNSTDTEVGSFTTSTREGQAIWPNLQLEKVVYRVSVQTDHYTDIYFFTAAKYIPREMEGIEEQPFLIGIIGALVLVIFLLFVAAIMREVLSKISFV